MIKELFETGKTVDAAIDSACEKLGCLREDCEWEIIDLPKKGFLGLKNFPAKVRVSIEIPEEKPVKAQRQPEQRQQRPVNSQKIQQAEKSQPAAKPQQIGKPQQPAKPQQAESGEKNRRDKQVSQTRAAKKTEPLKPGEISEKEIAARDYISSILEASDLKADFEISREHGGSYINIIGEGLGTIIGRRGETLDALQYLAGLVANRAEGDYLRLTVDCGDYRIKRKATLESLAKKLASQVLKTNVSRTLEPMNPFERRIIHATVSEIEGVSSSSIGEEPNRRVVITSPTAKPASRGGYRSDRDNSRGYNRNRGPRGDSAARVETAGQAETGERSYNRDKNSGRDVRRDDRRDDRGRDDRRNDRRDGGGGRPRQQSQPAPQGPPKQTPESEKTAGFSFGKIEL